MRPAVACDSGGRARATASPARPLRLHSAALKRDVRQRVGDGGLGRAAVTALRTRQPIGAAGSFDKFARKPTSTARRTG